MKMYVAILIFGSLFTTVHAVEHPPIPEGSKVWTCVIDPDEGRVMLLIKEPSGGGLVLGYGERERRAALIHEVEQGTLWLFNGHTDEKNLVYDSAFLFSPEYGVAYFYDRRLPKTKGPDGRASKYDPMFSIPCVLAHPGETK